MSRSHRSHFVRIGMIACFALPMLTSTTRALALEPDDAEKIRKDIMEMVQDRMKRERAELMAEIEKILDRAIAQEKNAKKSGDKQLEEARRTIEELRRRVAELSAELARARGEEVPRRRAADDDPAILGFAFEDADGGIRVTQVIPNSPAATIFKSGDVITEIDGKKVNAESFVEHMQSKRAGDRVSLTYKREVNGDTREMAARPKLVSRAKLQEQIDKLIAELEEPTPEDTEPEPAPRRDVERAPDTVSLGIVVREENFKLTLQEVSGGSNAAEAGLKAGDILLAVNNNKITTLESLRDAIGTLAVGRDATFRFERDGRMWESVVRLGGGDRAPALKSNKEIGAKKPEPTPRRERRRGFLGIMLEDPAQLVVGEVEPGSAAEKMGMKSGDQIVEINGSSVASLNDLRDALQRLYAGDDVTIKVKRARETRTLKGTLAARPENPQARASGSAAPAASVAATRDAQPRPASAKSGQSAKRGLGITAGYEGEQVTLLKVFEQSSAAAAGLKVGDIILRANGELISTLEALEESVRGDSVTLRIQRSGERLRIEVPLAPLPAAALQLIEDEAKSVATTAAKRVQLGVELSESPQGLEVYAIFDGPCKDAGWRRGDQLLSIGGKPLKTLAEVRKVVQDCKSGDQISATLRRGDRQITAQVSLVPRGE